MQWKWLFRKERTGRHAEVVRQRIYVADIVFGAAVGALDIPDIRPGHPNNGCDVLLGHFLLIPQLPHKVYYILVYWRYVLLISH